MPDEQARCLSRAAARNAKYFREYGATRLVEAFGDDVSKGEVTDYYRAVKAEDGESVVFAFIEWPDKQTRDQAWEKIMKDERMQPQGDMPFDGKRMFWGGFDKILDTAQQRGAAGRQRRSPPDRDSQLTSRRENHDRRT